MARGKHNGQADHKIYTLSFSKLKPGTKKYLDLVKSGKVWENYFRPFEWRAQDYDFCAKHSGFLDEMSTIKNTIEIPAEELQRSAESQIIWNNNYSIADLQHEEAQLPEPKSLLDKPGKEIEVVEIRNHLIATHYIYNTLLSQNKK
ncbi:1957_t:CDS:2 [Paraglomus occultum]|uniref:1957_t:CDS:1 n=1 Tax=Paraglomus occultum TaxID=144539 RepID=A0A9N9ABM7_9GLOM|nr:1957_t:CDS:2 [Paraglomus occultum]